MHLPIKSISIRSTVAAYSILLMQHRIGSIFATIEIRIILPRKQIFFKQKWIRKNQVETK